jgi:hypothetical protein
MFVRSISAIIIQIATPSSGYTFSVSALEFGFGTFAVFAGTHFLGFVRVVATIVLEIAEPASERKKEIIF